VIDITPGAVVSVTTGSGVYRGRNLVITAGPWANRLLTHTALQLPLKVHAYTVHSFFLSYLHFILSIHPFILLFTHLFFFHSPTFFFISTFHALFMHPLINYIFHPFLYFFLNLLTLFLLMINLFILSFLSFHLFVIFYLHPLYFICSFIHSLIYSLVTFSIHPSI